MRFLRNPEVFWVFVPDLLIAAITSVLLYRLSSQTDIPVPAWKLTLIVVVAFVLMGVVFLIVSGVYANKVRLLTHRIKKNMRGHRDFQFDDCREDDFSKLQSAVKKMVNAHFQQEGLLQAEKEHLAKELSDISHQLKTPLAAISLNAELLASPDMEPSRRRMTAHRTSELVKRISTLVKTLLNESRMDAGVAEFKQETFPIMKLIKKAVEPLEMSMDLHDQTLDLSKVDPDIMIEGDLFWMTEAVMNILKNCTEHTPDGGTIWIEVTDSATVTHITIRDSGPGISQEDMPHIFERFYTGKDSGRNTNSIGIGLAYSRQLLSKMGGNIEPGNHPDGGAQFTIYLFKLNV